MLIHAEFIKTAKKQKSKLAIIDRTTEKDFTYAKTLIAAIILAHKLKKYRDGYIGVMIPNSAGSALSVLGILFANKTPVMINYSTGAADNCRYAQNKCGFKTIITSKKLLEKIQCPMVPGMVLVEDILESVTTVDKLQAAVTSKMPLGYLKRRYCRGKMDDDLVILFTSGSEKDPKGVQLTHRNLHSNILNIVDRINIEENDIFLGILPFFHVFGFNTNFCLPLTTGCTLVTYANPLDFKSVVSIIREYRVTIVLGTPIFFIGYLRNSEPGDFSSIRIAVAGADKTPDWLRKKFLDQHNLQLLEGYGTTETSPVVSVNTPEEDRPGSIGKPLPNVQVKITELESGRPLPDGREGKLLVKGDLVMKGYFDDIEETSLRIRDGWYDTGDIGMLDPDGYLWHRGRLKRFVKIGGEMVSLVRTESVLNSVLPDEIDCCVVEIPDKVRGAKIIAAVTREINERKILKEMAKQLPNLFLPREFVVIKDLPKMGTGKVDFRTVGDLIKSTPNRYGGQ